MCVSHGDEQLVIYDRFFLWKSNQLPATNQYKNSVPLADDGWWRTGRLLIYQQISIYRHESLKIENWNNNKMVKTRMSSVIFLLLLLRYIQNWQMFSFFIKVHTYTHSSVLDTLTFQIYTEVFIDTLDWQKNTTHK